MAGRVSARTPEQFHNDLYRRKLEAIPSQEFMGCSDLPLQRVPGTSFSISISQVLGDRKTQEDRISVCPALAPFGQRTCAFFSLFDGTVGDFASETCKDIALEKLLESANWRACQAEGPPRDERAKAQEDLRLEQSLKETYRCIDHELLNRASRESKHYATCTGISVLLCGDAIAIAHVGDSRIYLARANGADGPLDFEQTEQLTMDHKPNQPEERQRIERNGGQVEYLQNHNNKPFIRGGDFTMRKALGEQPMQLQYSRAFGGKDLKIFGLSSEPETLVIRMGSPGYSSVRWLILASDGLWDVCTGKDAVSLCHQAVVDGKDPSNYLTQFALYQQKKRKARSDNVTAICVQFHGQ